MRLSWDNFMRFLCSFSCLWVQFASSRNSDGCGSFKGSKPSNEI